MVAIPEYRLYSKITVCNSTGCWIWTGAKTSSGYGQIRFQKMLYAAHRLMYTLLKGEIPLGLDLDHLCRVRHCVNPDHLEPVTRLENIRRGIVGENSRSKTHCLKGHPFTGDNVYLDPRGKRGCKICREVSRIKNRLKV